MAVVGGRGGETLRPGRELASGLTPDRVDPGPQRRRVLPPERPGPPCARARPSATSGSTRSSGPCCETAGGRTRRVSSLLRAGTGTDRQPPAPLRSPPDLVVVHGFRAVSYVRGWPPCLFRDGFGHPSSVSRPSCIPVLAWSCANGSVNSRTGQIAIPAHDVRWIRDSLYEFARAVQASAWSSNPARTGWLTVRMPRPVRTLSWRSMHPIPARIRPSG